MAAEAQAFGIAVRASRSVPGLVPGVAGTDGQPTTLDLGGVPEPPPAAGWERFFDRRTPDGEPFLAIDRDGDGRFRFVAPGHGEAVVAGDGRGIDAWPASGAGSRWLRLLYAQVLPLAATLRGHEILHAGAVAWRGRVVALSGAAGAGKSSVGAHLLASGARFVTDDALAIAHSPGGRPAAHPGARFASVPAHELAFLTDAAQGLLGPRLGATDKPHFAPEGIDDAMSLDTLCELVRTPDGPTRIEESTLRVPWLLGATFVPYVTAPDRLERQLDLCAGVAQTVRALRIVIAPGARAADVAERLLAHLDG